MGSNKILTCNNDNAASNDTQIAKLTKLPNMFEETNHVHCFDHTLQLLAKTLLKPFNIVLANGKNDFTEDLHVLELKKVGDDESVEDDDDGDGDADSAFDFNDADDGICEADAR